GQGEIDRTAAGIAVQARVAAAFEDVDLPAPAGEQGGEQGPGQAGTDDGQARPGLHACPVRQASTPRTKRRMSAWLLYSGAGEMRMTSGSRQSPTMPLRSRYSNRARPRSRPPTTRSDSCAPRRAGSRGVTTCRV